MESKDDAKLEKARNLLAQARKINGHVPLDGYEIRELKGIDDTGRWITGCPTRSLMGYVRIRRSGQASFLAACRWIIAHEADIRQRRGESLAAADLS